MVQMFTFVGHGEKYPVNLFRLRTLDNSTLNFSLDFHVAPQCNASEREILSVYIKASAIEQC